MTMNPLPPQAYTKETLLRAYHWLQNQPGSIKEMALTPDILVSLYLKASRDGDQALERPSIQNFKSELRNLAGLMGELESGPAPSPTASPPVPPPVTTAPPPPAKSPQPQIEVKTPVSEPPKPSMEPALEIPDLSTGALIREIKQLFNLSSDQEALRMLVKIGYEHAKTVLPPRPHRDQ